MASFEEQLMISNTMIMKKRMGGKGRQKIEMKKMAEFSNRQVTFSKRRKTLFKDADNLVRFSPNTRIAVFALSEKGNPHSYGNCPDAETLIDQYLDTHNHGCHNDVNARNIGSGSSGVVAENLGLEELEGYANLFREMRSDVENRISNLNTGKNKVDDPLVFDFKNQETVMHEGDQDLGTLHDLEWMNCGDFKLDDLKLDDFGWMNAADADSGLLMDDCDQMMNVANVDECQWINSLFQDFDNLA